ncbi:MAG TPA: PqqD family protein [Actinomycetales bacterium]|nr:PqqD family protein [Actinomycetales bacterium]
MGVPVSTHATHSARGGADGDHRFGRARDVLWRYTAEGVVLLPLKASEPFVLEGAGAALWEVLREPQTVQAAAKRLSQRFSVPPEEVLSTVPAVLTELADRGAVTDLGGGT